MSRKKCLVNFKVQCFDTKAWMVACQYTQVSCLACKESCKGRLTNVAVLLIWLQASCLLAEKCMHSSMLQRQSAAQDVTGW